MLTTHDKENTECPGALSSQYLTIEMNPQFKTRSCLLLPLSESTPRNIKQHTLHYAEEAKTWPVPKIVPGNSVCSVRIVQPAHIPDNIIKNAFALMLDGDALV